MMSRAELTISFPTKRHRDDFTAWLSDGGGEYIYMEGQTIVEDTAGELTEIVEFDYEDDTTVHCYAERAKRGE